MISIVIPFHNKAATITKCIEHIKESNLSQEYEIILVNDDASFKEEKIQGHDVTIVDNPNKGSAARARNFGVKNSKGDILVFIDSDVLVQADTIEKLIKPIINKEAEACVGNYSKDIKGLNFYQAYKQLYVHCIYSRRSGEINSEFWTAIGAVSREAFDSVGGFPENFTGATGEDTEFGLMLSQAGFTIHAVPEATGQHLNQFSLLRLIKNDLTKGLVTTYNSIKNKSSFNNNRHTSKKDITAVFFACAIVLFFLISLCSTNIFSFILFLVCLACYLKTRNDLTHVFKMHGALFTTKAIIVQIILDITRALAVALGLTKALLSARHFGK